MKAVTFERIGSPREVLALSESLPEPEVEDGKALVRMVASSINPGDFLFIENLYPEPKKPRFPHQIAGNHGAGIVTAVGNGVSIPVGTLVAFSYFNTWAEYAAVPAEWLIPLPADYPTEKAAQFFNFITVWDLIDDARVNPGNWLALTASNATVPVATLQFARRRGIKVLSLVRRRNPLVDLEALGADAVIDLETLPPDTLGDRVQEITGGRGLNAIIDCVGGPLLSELIRSTALGAQIIVYGGMSAETFSLHNLDVLLRVIEIRSNVYRYFFTPPRPEDTPLLRELAEITGSPDFRVPIAGLHPLEDFQAAVEATLDQPGLGKRILRCT